MPHKFQVFLTLEQEPWPHVNSGTVLAGVFVPSRSWGPLRWAVLVHGPQVQISTQSQGGSRLPHCLSDTVPGKLWLPWPSWKVSPVAGPWSWWAMLLSGSPSGW